MARICLLSPVPVWLNPRLRKEADALLGAGYDVVVGYRADDGAERDDAILATKRWPWRRLDFDRRTSPVKWFAGAVRQRLASTIIRARRASDMPRFEAEAYCRGFTDLRDWAIAQRADLYIAHTQPVLAVAAAAAAATGARFAFDCEDLLAEEAADGLRSTWRHELIRRLERRYLPSAAYVSATSVPMAEYLAAQYGLGRAKVWHNCFPAAEVAHLAAPAARPPTAKVELTWMSATIGQGRGLEDVLQALPRLGSQFILYLYGNVHPSQQVWFEAQLAALGGRAAVVVRPIPTPNDVMATLAHHDIGLTLDRNDCLNRSLTVCNKLFLYLQAGLACVATDTPGQMSVLGNRPTVGATYHEGDVEALVTILRALSDRSVLAERQSAAWQLGRTQYVWDAEQPLFLQAVEEALRAA